jgi:hypothetical protein
MKHEDLEQKQVMQYVAREPDQEHEQDEQDEIFPDQ